MGWTRKSPGIWLVNTLQSPPVNGSGPHARALEEDPPGQGRSQEPTMQSALEVEHDVSQVLVRPLHAKGRLQHATCFQVPQVLGAVVLVRGPDGLQSRRGARARDGVDDAPDLQGLWACRGRMGGAVWDGCTECRGGWRPVLESVQALLGHIKLQDLSLTSVW